MTWLSLSPDLAMRKGECVLGRCEEVLSGEEECRKSLNSSLQTPIHLRKEKKQVKTRERVMGRWKRLKKKIKIKTIFIF